MSALPEWAKDIDGFDPERWWLAIVCTGNETHPPALLEVAYEHTERGSLLVAGIHARATDRPPNDAEREAERVAEAAGWFARLRPDRPALRTRRHHKPGSVNLACPSCGRTPRMSRDEWGTIIDAARHAGDTLFDLSRSARW